MLPPPKTFANPPPGNIARPAIQWEKKKILGGLWFGIQKTEIIKLKSENWNQKTEVRKQKSEKRNQETEIRKQKSENRNQKTEIRKLKS